MDIKAFDGKHNTHTVAAHYDAIAKMREYNSQKNVK